MDMMVVGATGLIGQSIYRLAKANHIRVNGTSASARMSWVLFRLEKDSATGLVHEYLQGRNSCLVLAGAITNINRCCQERDLSHAVNVEGTLRLIDACCNTGVKVVFLSSDAVFDGKKGGYGEADSANPLCVYGSQKREVEEACLRDYPEVLIYRLSKQVSSSTERGNLFADLYRQYQSGEEIRCIDGLRFQPTFVEDTAACILQGVRMGLKGLFHVAAPAAFSRQDLAQSFFEAGGVRDAVVRVQPVESFRFLEPKALDTTMKTEKFQQVADYEFCDVRIVMKAFWQRVREESWM